MLIDLNSMLLPILRIIAVEGLDIIMGPDHISLVLGELVVLHGTRASFDGRSYV